MGISEKRINKIEERKNKREDKAESKEECKEEPTETAKPAEVVGDPNDDSVNFHVTMKM